MSGSEKDNLPVNLPKDRNQSLVKNEVILVVQPGVFDYQSNEYVVRLRLWGIGFPERDQPGFNDAISASERLLLGVPIDISVKQEFDSKNLKVVQVHGQIKKNDLGREIISQGFGWHLDDETDRYGPYVLSQLKAKRLNLWSLE